MKGRDIIAAILIGGFILAVSACGTQRKLRDIQQKDIRASLSLPEQKDYLPEVENLKTKADTFTVMDGGRKLLIMNAIQDEDGNMVAHQQLEGAVVVAQIGRAHV